MGKITLENINMVYGKGNNQLHALTSINLEINQGELVAVLGKSGCGKSTLLNIIGGLVKPTSGKYYHNQTEISKLSVHQLSDFRNQNIGFIVQHFALIQDMSVLKNVSLPLRFRGDKKEDIRKKTTDILDLLDLSSKKNNYPYELSGGQCQRAAIARALVGEPSIILADEPTGALDEETGRKILDILLGLNKKGKTVIVVTHDQEIADLCSRKIVIRDGVIVKDEG